MRKLKKFFKGCLMICAAFVLVGILAAGVFGYIIFNVGIDKDAEGKFNRDTILSSLSGETRVFFRDGNRKLGAFFDANHRIYVPFGEIPEHLVNALVAAEDARFFEHHGFDFRGFIRAMATNLRSGSFRQGGSTLTQQTVKNVFGREERTISEKYRELRNAVKLERHFTKEQILEFYLNQFHVSGSGKGVAIAAQYFFNKELKNLNLAECAFIAGSVKGPFNYDPFAQRNEEKREEALRRGEKRVRYVLDRMLEEGYISKEERDEALKTPLAFEHGTFRYSVSTQLEQVEEKLNSEYFQTVFQREGIEDWRRAQLEIVTTLDADYQEAAKRALQANISSLQMKLGGFVLPSAERANRALSAELGDYLYGALDSSAVDSSGKLSALYLSFGQIRGIVESETLRDFEKEVGSPPEKVLAAKLGKGSVLLVSVIDSLPKVGFYRCRLETEPVLQGALVALRNGEVLASQGGFHNTGFDRSFKALRQLGSSWKPLLYALAFQYGWNYLDELENDFNAFQYGNQFYFPRPDHKNKGKTVSIAWAATRSENIASVWLLKNLYDKLSEEDFASVMDKNGYAKYAEESDKEYFVRLRDSLGLVLREATKREIEFDRARARFVEEMLAVGRTETALAAKNMLYGSFLDVATKAAKTPENRKNLQHNFLRYEEILRERRLAETNPDLTQTLPAKESVELFPGFSLADFQRLSLLVLPVDAEANYLEASHLRFWPDFRFSLAMADFARFVKEMGIHSKLQKVPSMVLGANDVSLAEITMAYQTILSGKIFRCEDGDWTEPCLIKEIRNRDGKLIFKNSVSSKEIFGDTITSQMTAILRSVFTNGTARSQWETLSLTSEEGRKLRFPAVGKTGTTNDFRNVAFLGALPGYSEQKNGFAADSLIAIGSYVGFDNNKPLRSGKTRIAGSSGGLPQWASFAKDILKIRKDAERVDFYSIQNIKEGEVPYAYSNLRGDLQVDAISGLSLASFEDKSRKLPWLEVPGFVPAGVQSEAAKAAAEGGFISIAPSPALEVEEEKPILPEGPSENFKETSSDNASDDDWELPEDFKGDNAFVPIGVEF